jgi:glycerophosphoryl diester phosphodiesterase
METTVVRMSNAAADVFVRLAALAHDAPIVVAHRGDSRHHPENTLAAFAAARALGVVVQEFDVRVTRDGTLVCVHDESVDRTTDGARRLGPGALIEQLTWREVHDLDAGTWAGAPPGQRVPTLAQVLATLGAGSFAVVEHKAGTAAAFVAALAENRDGPCTVLQSFDWRFVQAARAIDPALPLAVLGPTPEHATCDDATIRDALAVGAGMIHWHDRGLRRSDVLRAHAAGLFVCTYTTDDELGWFGGAALGIDAMCTNDPGAMLHLRRAGHLRRAH